MQESAASQGGWGDARGGLAARSASRRRALVQAVGHSGTRTRRARRALKAGSMQGTVQPLAVLALCGGFLLYATGQRQARLAGQPLKARHKAACALGCLCLATAFLSPLATLRHEFLFARALQQILAGILAPPLLWYGQALAVAGQGLPASWREGLRRLPFTRPRLIAGLQCISSPGATWPFALCVFVLWHDPAVVERTMAQTWTANFSLWLYCVAFLLFWWHAMDAPPRLHPSLPVWVRFLYLIAGGEIANLIVGVSLAFRAYPIYGYYAAATGRAGLTALQDQMISGGLIWVTGSFVYVFVAVALLGQALFRRPWRPRVPPREWQSATWRTIAPGLEARLPETTSPSESRQ